MLIDYSDNKMVRLLINKTRMADLMGPALADAHREVGRWLAGSIACHLTLEEVEIQHVAGTSMGIQLKSGTEPIIVALMRAGLFVAEGIWSSLPGSSLIPHSKGATLDALGQPPIVVVDSVINTGRTIREVLSTVKSLRPAQIAVAALVAYRPTLNALVSEFPEVTFHVARVSDRSYVGKGITDTGARLFGTARWKSEY